jgi:hypothetical protein
MDPITSNGECVADLVYVLRLVDAVQGMQAAMLATEDADAVRRFRAVLASYQGRLADASARVEAYMHRADGVEANGR